ncbi:peptide ABC transporter permease [Spirochaetia bacterium]|nr:peptide ABC transporter permease [Spirochaetia bacterium]
MKKYLRDKLLQYVIVLFAASVIVFIMVRLNPADPVAVILGGKQSTPETVANLRASFNLDKPYITQYTLWITGVFKGNLGSSFKYRQQVSALIGERLPVTAGIVILSSLILLLIAIPSGIITAVKQNSIIDTGISVIQLILVASPPFLTSILMIWIITVIAPTFRFTGSFSNFGQYLQRIILPSIALAFSMIALTSRIMKTGMVEQLDSNYRMAAVAKGMPFTDVVIRHCLKNAIIPVITVFGTQFGILIVGSVLVETVFSLAGLGSILIEGIKSSDYPLVQGLTMLLVFVFMTISTLLDIVYGLIDPRIASHRGHK